MASLPKSLKAVLVVGDGLSDRPVSALNGKTPLEVARTPALDNLAKVGITGLLHVIAPGIPPGSDTGHLALFGYDSATCYTGRGPFEALGAGFDLHPKDVAFRGNFATVKPRDPQSFQVLDRRAGRQLPEGAALAELINGIAIPGITDVEVFVTHTVEHRCAVVLRGSNLSPKISDTDPHDHGDTVLQVQALDKSMEAKRTAMILNKLTNEFHNILSVSTLNQKRRKAGLPEANMVLLRGAGTLPNIPPLHDLYGIKSACVAGGALYKGVARSAGMEVLSVPGATASYDTNVEAKAQAAITALDENDFVFVHLKPTDSAAHDKDCKKKVAMTEKLDHLVAMLIRGIDPDNIYCAVTTDHTTSCVTGDHTGDSVPVLISGPEVRSDGVKRFSERACAFGGLGHLHGTDLMPTLMNYLNRTRMFGA